jgi:hypothetical protein
VDRKKEQNIWHRKQAHIAMAYYETFLLAHSERENAVIVYTLWQRFVSKTHPANDERKI